MTWLAETAMLAHGWRRVLLLLVAGALAALSMPPLFILPGLFVGLPILVWALDGAERGTGWKQVFGPAFAIGFWFGLGYFATALHWIGAAFFVDGGWLLIAMPFAILALAAVLALFWAAATALAHLLWFDGPARLFLLAAALGIAEFARGHLFTGFPFDLVGYALTANAEMMQLASIIGIYGLTLIALLAGMTPALVWPAGDRALGTRLLPLVLAVLLVALQIGFGALRLSATPLAAREDMRLRLVQPAIAQIDKWDPTKAGLIVDRLMSLSQQRIRPADPGLIGATHLVWPEAALPHYLAEYPETLARITSMLPAGTTLLTGAPHLETEPALGAAAGDRTASNTILAIANGQIVDIYRKAHLVPFGEYLPFESLFARLGLSQFVPGAHGWVAGPPRRPLRLPGSPPILPLICYEAAFSGDLGTDIADSVLLLNLTNDAWFDGSLGAAQHFHHARLRAVEEGRPLIRVANTGVTAAVDPLGRVTARLRAAEPGLLDVVPDQPVATLFATLRHWPFGLGIGVLLAIGGWRAQRRRI